MSTFFFYSNIVDSCSANGTSIVAQDNTEAGNLCALTYNSPTDGNTFFKNGVYACPASTEYVSPCSRGVER